MTATITADGRVTIEFYIVRTKDTVEVVTTEPPPLPNCERLGPFEATALVVKRIAVPRDA